MMLSPIVYRTLDSPSEGVFKDKGSRFIAYAAPCNTDEDAKSFLADWKKLHPHANHLCYAYRIGADNKNFRVSDDGEPNNSAGAPILGQIQSFDLTNVLVGVVRYFGGTKLGVGGLIQAYKAAARDAIQNGRIIERQLMEEVVLHFVYDQLPLVMSFAKSRGVSILESNLGIECSIRLEIPLDRSQSIHSALEGVTIISNGIR